MSTFLGITSESRFAGTYVKNRLMGRVESYITHNLHDDPWQDSISPQLRNKTGHHETIGIILRFFSMQNIEAGKLKSYAGYMKKDDRLIIDPMLVIEDYADLAEDEMRKKSVMTSLIICRKL